MKELIFNLFLFIEDGNIYELGAVVHDRDGTDADKLSFLQAQVSNDLEKAKRFSLPSRYEMTVQSKNSRIAGMRYEMFKILKSMGRHIEVFEEVFQVFNGPSDPLVCITPIVDDKPRIDKEDYSNIHNLETTRDIQQITEFAMSDYLTEYLTKDGLDLPKLFNDDYFLAIKLLYKNSHFASALKLLMSFIDTVAYLEFGNVNGNFQKWLNLYADLSPLEIDASELWEFRNSLLHQYLRQNQVNKTGFME